ncbi:hypothetical protein GCM10023263_43550 [Phytohabitans rumicis]
MKTVRSGALFNAGSNSAATVPAVAQCRCSSAGLPARKTSAIGMSSDTASARQPFAAAVNAAPTVPECSRASPVLAPRLMPDSTSSGGGPNAPNVAISAMNPGEPATPYDSTPSSPSSGCAVTTIRPSCLTAVMAALIPLASSIGAATTTSSPASTAARASARIPGAAMPSSLVTNTFIALPLPARLRARPSARPCVRVRLRARARASIKGKWSCFDLQTTTICP